MDAVALKGLPWKWVPRPARGGRDDAGKGLAGLTRENPQGEGPWGTLPARVSST